MDVLSDVVTAARAGLPHSARMLRTAPFGRSLPATGGAGFHAVLRGTAWLIPPDGDPIPLGTGDVVFLPRGGAHGLADSPSTPLTGASPAVPRSGPGRGTAPAGDGDTAPAGGAGPATVILCGAYLLDRSRAHPLLEELPEIVHLGTGAGRHPGLGSAAGLLGEELERSRPGSDAMVPALLDVLLLQILRAWLDERAGDGATTTGWSAALHDPAVAAALRAIHGEPGRRWSVEELGRHAGLSRAAFARRFTSLVGRPPLAYLTWWRMSVAARLLHDSDAPSSAVAARVGYASEFAFAHAFKRAYGLPPGAYRRRERVRAGE
ncbi:AraC family transcriptional regulator [Streptosporangium longisporum]|uniref:AraC family transcriptional regulator n=1 Tax=Streptosporangium longisporum TaxID=46187 RepID=A0ABP6L648_9ACTN